jgi:Phage tail tube protein
MTTCAVNKIDSNATGLRFAEEECLGMLYPEADNKTIWYPLEPNTYTDFGGQITTVARAPINPSRQNQKGVVTDLAASGGFNQDFTIANSARLMQGFMFATAHEKNTTKSINAPIMGNNVAVTGVTAADGYVLASALPTPFPVGALVFASGFGVATNNGLHSVTASTGATGTVTPAFADEAAPPATAEMTQVGQQFPAGDLSLTMVGGLPVLNTVANDFTTMGLLEGEWIFIGGDATIAQFASGTNGFARIGSGGLKAKTLTFDKVDFIAAADPGTAKTIQLFFGTVIRNELDPTLIVRRTYQIERTLGADASGDTQSETLIGAAANEFTLNIPEANKLNTDMTFVGTDAVARTGAQGLLYGDRPTIELADAFNTSSDFSRIKLSAVDPTTADVTPLFAFLTTMTLTIKNNVAAAKAVANLGAIDMSIGSFDVGGSLTAYFADVTAVQAVRNNQSCTLDMIAVKDNTGILFDVPLLTLGNGRIAITKDQPVTLPLDTNGAQSQFGNTLLFQTFPYLPNLSTQ